MGLAVLCPGQGAQHVGMGVDVADAWPGAREVLDQAADVLGLDLLHVLREGPEKELVRTDLQQPAILAAGAATYAALLESRKLEAEDVSVAFGLSLGEFTALYIAGALTLRDALVLVRERGLGMQEASEASPSGLSALRCEAELAEEVCRVARHETGGVCSIANLNAPGQVVISGDLPSLEAAEAAARGRGVRRAIRLPVAGAFHSVLMEPGARRLERALGEVEVRPPRIPIISNVTASATRDPATIRANLVAQVTSPVRFVDCVRAASALGADRTLEVAPGRVLSGLVRRIDPAIATETADTAEAIDGLVAPPAVRGGEA